MVQEIHLDFKRRKQRDIKLHRFAEGGLLSPEDLKFIVDTSDLLNSCVDRNFLQDAINTIDDEVIRNLELYLSENILMNYEEIKAVIKESRLLYLKEKNKSYLEQAQNKKEKVKRTDEVLEKRKKSQKTVKMFRTIYEKIRKGEVKLNGKKEERSWDKEIKKRELHPPSKIMSNSYYEKNDIFDKEKGRLGWVEEELWERKKGK